MRPQRPLRRDIRTGQLPHAAKHIQAIPPISLDFLGKIPPQNSAFPHPESWQSSLNSLELLAVAVPTVW